MQSRQLLKARHGAEAREKVRSAKVGFFRHYFRVCEKKSRKNVSLKHFLHSVTNFKHSMFRF